jgi:hypothetical protein
LQVSFVHSGTLDLHVPLMHCSPTTSQAGVAPVALAAALQQSSMPPQPSLWSPQLAPIASQVVGVHTPPLGTPQWLGTPAPPQVSGSVQDEQSMRLPQPSLIGPHSPTSHVFLHAFGLLPISMPVAAFPARLKGLFGSVELLWLEAPP